MDQPWIPPKVPNAGHCSNIIKCLNLTNLKKAVLSRNDEIWNTKGAFYAYYVTGTIFSHISKFFGHYSCSTQISLGIKLIYKLMLKNLLKMTSLFKEIIILFLK